MSSLFDPVQAGDLRLPNRVVMAPLTRNRAPDAIPTPLMAEYYAQRASAGLIVSEATAISHQGQGYADVPGLYGTEQLDAWKRVTDAVHARGGRMVVQLWHVGRVSHVALQPGGQKPVAPSAITAKTKTFLIQEGGGRFVETSEPRALRAEEIPGIVRDYRHAARHAMTSAGFDGVEVHGANGYLLDQFLKATANQRTDAYGGPTENRARLLLEVMREVVEEIGAAAPGCACPPSRPRTTCTTPSRSRCSSTWCASSRRWDLRTCTSSKAPPAARASCPTAPSTTRRCGARTGTRVGAVPGW